MHRHITRCYGIFIMIVLRVCGFESNKEISRQESCLELPERISTAYYGFPFALQYSFRMKITVNRLGQKELMEHGLNVSCNVIEKPSGAIVRKSNFTQLNVQTVFSMMDTAFRIPEVTYSVNVTIRCEFATNSSSLSQNEMHCVSYNARIVLQDMPSSDCNGDPVIPQLITKDLTRERLHHFTCAVPKDYERLIKSRMVTVEWYRYGTEGCRNESESSLVVNSDKFQIIFERTDFADAGLYSCMIQFKGKRILIAKYDVCVKYQHIRNKDIALKCSDVKTEVNEDVNISCSVTVSIGKSNPATFYWNKMAEDTTTVLCNSSHSHHENVFECSEIRRLKEDICYRSEPPSTDAGNDMRTITLRIRNVKKSDFGLYQLEYYPDGGGKLIGNVTVREHARQKENIVNFAIVGVLCLCVIALVIILIAKKKDILWFMKRYFGTLETADPDIYTARLLYMYSSDSDDESMERTKTLVDLVENFVVGNIGGTVYNEQRNAPLAQFDSENIVAMHDNCQTIVIILSPKFVKEHWSRYATYTAFGSAIRDGKKIILLTMPGTKDAIELIADEPRKTLKWAMKRLTTIRWNGKAPFSGKFHRRLEYALPKLDKS